MKICKLRLTKKGKSELAGIATLVGLLFTTSLVLIGTVNLITLFARDIHALGPFSNTFNSISIVVAVMAWSYILYRVLKETITTWFECKE